MLVEQAIADLEKAKQKVLSWWSAEGVALSLKAKFANKDISVSYHLPENYGKWCGIFIHVHKVEKFGDLKEIFRFLGNHGYLHNGKPEIYEEIQRVSWDLGDIKLLAFFTDDESSICRFVKIKKEEETYKFVCPDMPA